MALSFAFEPRRTLRQSELGGIKRSSLQVLGTRAAARVPLVPCYPISVQIIVIPTSASAVSGAIGRCVSFLSRSNFNHFLLLSGFPPVLSTFNLR